MLYASIYVMRTRYAYSTIYNSVLLSYASNVCVCDSHYAVYVFTHDYMYVFTYFFCLSVWDSFVQAAKNSVMYACAIDHDEFLQPVKWSILLYT